MLQSAQVLLDFSGFWDNILLPGRRLVEQDKWARQQAAQNASNFWVAIGAVFTQFDGLLAGYQARVGAAAAAADAAAAEASNGGGGAGGFWAAAAKRRLAAAAAKQEGGGGVGFGARPVPPPLTRADLLMVSAVGASCLGQPAIACSLRVPDAVTCRRLHSVLVWRPRSRVPGFTAGGSESLGCALQHPRCLQAVTGDALTDDADIADLIPGDLGDLIPALDAAARPAWHAMQPAELAATLATRGKCSALVKVAGEQTLLLRHPASGAVTSPVAACSTHPASTAVSAPARCEIEQTITCYHILSHDRHICNFVYDSWHVHAGDLSDLLLSHSSWYTFAAMQVWLCRALHAWISYEFLVYPRWQRSRTCNDSVWGMITHRFMKHS